MTKPSAGAMRAAKALFPNIAKSAETFNESDESDGPNVIAGDDKYMLTQAAKVIDREVGTNVAALDAAKEALKAATNWTGCDCSSKYCGRCKDDEAIR